MITLFKKRLPECCYFSRSNFIALMDNLRDGIEELMIQICTSPQDSKSLRSHVWSLADWMYYANTWRCFMYVTEEDYKKHLFGPFASSLEDSVSHLQSVSSEYGLDKLSGIHNFKVAHDIYHCYIELFCTCIDILLDYDAYMTKQEWFDLLMSVFFD